jgi:phosphoserine phosphatase
VTAFGSVVFDCDSTLSSIEGIDELGRAHQTEIAALTDAAMRGAVPLEEVYGRRLERVRPSADDVAALGRAYVRSLVPDAREVVAALQRAGVVTAIISGGIRPAVLAVAEALGVDERLVWAVDVRFDALGAYAGFDEGSPLARAGGKRDLLLAQTSLLPPPVMLVGDGATDLEAAPAVDLFVAYAGVAVREPVVAGAGAVVRSASLAPVLALALGAEPAGDPELRALHERGRALLQQPH